MEGESGRWQGKYQVSGFSNHIIIVSTPGIGDVTTQLPDGTKLYVESKKGKTNKSSQEYPLMREAIGQIMTSGVLTDDMITAVAVPFSEKSYELAVKWSRYLQIRQVGIRFFLVKVDVELYLMAWYTDSVVARDKMNLWRLKWKLENM